MDGFTGEDTFIESPISVEGGKEADAHSLAFAEQGLAQPPRAGVESGEESADLVAFDEVDMTEPDAEGGAAAEQQVLAREPRDRNAMGQSASFPVEVEHEPESEKSEPGEDEINPDDYFHEAFVSLPRQGPGGLQWHGGRVHH